MKKHHFNRKIKLAVTAIFLTGGLQHSHAEIPLPGGDDDVDDAPTAPVDGLLGLGLITGVIYGFRKIKKKE